MKKIFSIMALSVIMLFPATVLANDVYVIGGNFNNEGQMKITYKICTSNQTVTGPKYSCGKPRTDEFPMAAPVKLSEDQRLEIISVDENSDPTVNPRHWKAPINHCEVGGGTDDLNAIKVEPFGEDRLLCINGNV